MMFFDENYLRKVYEIISLESSRIEIDFIKMIIIQEKLSVKEIVDLLVRRRTVMINGIKEEKEYLEKIGRNYIRKLNEKLCQDGETEMIKQE